MRPENLGSVFVSASCGVGLQHKTQTQTQTAMSYNPERVGRYGNLAERWAAENYPITLDYPEISGLKFDATDSRGRPVDIKASMDNGVRPTFKFWSDQHSTLREESGSYLLVWYRAREDSIRVLSSRSLRASAIDIDNWTSPGEGHYRYPAREAQIPADRLRK